MKIAKIKDRYMFNSKNPNKTHDYLVYKDKLTNEIRAIELTHLYNVDKQRFALVRTGHLKKMYFKHRETPSGVNRYYFATNIYGGPIDLSHPDVNLNVYRKYKISNKQKNDVLKFAKNKRK